MSAQSVIDRYQGEQGWTDATVLGLLVDYIDNQGADDALDDHLAEACADPHDGVKCAYCDEPVDADDGESTPNGSMHTWCAQAHEQEHPEDW